MKKVISLVMLVVTLSMLIGCGSAATNEAKPLIVKDEQATAAPEVTKQSGDKPTIALVMKTLTNPFFVEMEKGARKAETELGINLVVKTGSQETSIEQQIAIIDGLITDKVKAIVIAPANSKDLIPVLKKAQDAGIIIINVDNRLDSEVSKQMGLVDVPFISVNNEQGGYMSAKYVSDQLKSPSEVIILEGIRTAGNANDRKNGAVRAFGENSNVKVVAMETANWKIDEAHDVTMKLLKQHPDVKAIFCANDMMGLGAIQALQESNNKAVAVVAYDALDDAKQAIKAGTLQATIDQQAALQAYTGVKFAVQALGGEKIPLETLVDVKLITKDNVDAK